MNHWPEGNAVVYCEGAFNTLNGKTAHGLVRQTRRYHIAAVVDSRYADQDAGDILDGTQNGILICATLEQALAHARQSGYPATHFVMGLAPDGGRLDSIARKDVRYAIHQGLNVDCGLHDYLSEDPEMAAAAKQKNIVLRDIRKPLHTRDLHFFTGKIDEVAAFKVAVLGSDSAIGKRTTSWKLVNACNSKRVNTEMIGTGQTAWMQGARYGIIMDSIANDFVTGELEHAIWSAWKETQADILVIEGQGGIMNPAYPGGFEILAAGRPDIVVFQYAPTRRVYDSFPDYPIHPLPDQIQLSELLSGKPVVAITINHEGMEAKDIPRVCDTLSSAIGLPVFDVLDQGPEALADLVIKLRNEKIK